jgi:type VI secretion system protein ImpF
MSPSHRPVQARDSWLELLQDDRPRQAREGDPVAQSDLDRHKQALARDLEALLNARCCPLEARLLEGFPQARRSLLNYGITDLSSLSLLNPDHRMLLRDQIRSAIGQFEPRLTEVRVSLDLPSPFSRMLRFRVEARLEVHPQHPPVVFDALLQLSSNACRIRSQG